MGRKCRPSVKPRLSLPSEKPTEVQQTANGSHYPILSVPVCHFLHQTFPGQVPKSTLWAWTTAQNNWAQGPQSQMGPGAIHNEALDR